jgi:hypothetical protein
MVECLLASMRPSVQTPILPKKKEEEEEEEK